MVLRDAPMDYTLENKAYLRANIAYKVALLDAAHVQGVSLANIERIETSLAYWTALLME